MAEESEINKHNCDEIEWCLERCAVLTLNNIRTCMCFPLPYTVQKEVHDGLSFVIEEKLLYTVYTCRLNVMSVIIE